MILFGGPSSALLMAGLAMTAYAAYGIRAAQGKAAGQYSLAWAAWLLHGLAIAQGWWGAERRFGFAPALNVTAWVAFLVYLIELQSYPQLPLRKLFTWSACTAMALAALWPGRLLHASISPWLPLHWVLGIASYGLFAVAVAHAGFMHRAEGGIRHAQAGETPLPLLTLERLTFRFVAVGFALLTASLAVALAVGEGGGGLLRWDHKSFFAVLSWLTFAVLLAGRWRLGWRGRRAGRMLYVGAALLLLSYVGSRFVLEVVLRRGG